MSDAWGKVSTLASGDHARGCQGRSYTCECGHDDAMQGALSFAKVEITRLQAELTEARESKGRIMIATAASVKASMDEYKRGHADGVKSGQEKGLDEAATELERLDGHGEWYEAAQAIRALKSPKPPIL